MKFRLSPLANTLSGVVGALDFVDRKDRPYVRTRPETIPEPSTAQTDVRDAYGHLVGYWHALTEEMRDAWNIEGDAIQLSGFNLFVQQNMYAVRNSLAPYLLPPSLAPSAPAVISSRRFPFNQSAVTCFLPQYTGSNLVKIWRWDTVNHTLVDRVSEVFTASIWHLHETSYWPAREDSYTMDSDTPSASLGTFPDLSKTGGGSITQLTTPDGLEMNTYYSNGVANTGSDSGNADFDCDVEFAVSFWIWAHTFANLVSNHNIFRISNTVQVIKAGDPSNVSFKFFGSGGNQTIGPLTLPTSRPVHIVLYNEGDGGRRRVYMDLASVLDESVTTSGHSAVGVAIKIGALAGAVSEPAFSLGNPVFWKPNIEWSSMCWEYTLRNPLMCSRDTGPVSSDYYAPVSIFQPISTSIGFTGSGDISPINIDD